MSREFKSLVQKLEKPFIVHPKVGVISENTKTWILENLKFNGVSNQPDESFQWVLKDEKGTSLSKRLRVWIERFAEVRIRDWSKVGHYYKTTFDSGTLDSMLQYIGTQINIRTFHHSTLYVDCVKGPFDWDSKEFGYGKSGSCWWDMHSCSIGLYTCGGNLANPCEINGLSAKDHYADHGGYCIRFFIKKDMSIKSSIGRIWLWPSVKNPRTGVLFNGYYKGTGNYGFELSSLIMEKFHLHSKAVRPKTIYYLNGNTIFLVGPKHLVEKTVIIERNTPLFEI